MASREDLLELEKQLSEIERRQREQSVDFYVPYQKQRDFHDAGLTHRERLLMAGNQNGKTYCGGAEASFHLTGLYPDDWLGRRWDRPVRAWVAGVTGESTRDNPQRILLGTIAKGIGTGSIPLRCLDTEKMTLARGVSNLYDTVLVKHIGPDGKQDGWSELKFKSYERGREKWQGDTLDFVWFDEEPPEDIYTEGLARISATSGMVYVTFTPLKGMSKVVLRYLNEPSPDRSVITMTIDDALHIPADERQTIIDGYPEHEREARALGIPLLGSGKIFQVAESRIKCEPFPIPPHWPVLWAIDFGTGHPFAAVLLAWDRDTDTIYVVHSFRMPGALPLQHAEAMKVYGDKAGGMIPVAWPQDGHQRREFDGQLVPLAKVYKKHGLKMCAHHATFEDGSNSTEVGIIEMQERMDTNRFKVFSTNGDWFDEFRLYHRKNGEIVKERDDIMSATRVGVMARRFARSVFYDLKNPNKSKTQIAKDGDFSWDW